MVETPDTGTGTSSLVKYLADADPFADNYGRPVVHVEHVTIDDLSSYPELRNLDDRIVQAIALTAFGFSPSTIGKAWGESSGKIRGWIERYDPQHKFSLSKGAKRAFLTKMLESRAAEAIAHITPEKLEKSSAAELASISERLLRAVTSMEPKESTRVLVGSVEDVLNRLKQAPIELIKAKDGTYSEAGYVTAGSDEDTETSGGDS